jgi:hypothetical protein
MIELMAVVTACIYIQDKIVMLFIDFNLLFYFTGTLILFSR